MATVMGHRDRGAARFIGPLYLLLFPIPVVAFLGALVTDVVYSATAFLMWLHFSQWLIAVGLAVGAVAALVLLIEFFATPEIRTSLFGWSHLVLFYAALIVELFNAFIHTIDGWTAVVPTGLTLSVVGPVLACGATAALFAVPVTWVEHDARARP